MCLWLRKEEAYSPTALESSFRQRWLTESYTAHKRALATTLIQRETQQPWRFQLTLTVLLKCKVFNWHGSIKTTQKEWLHLLKSYHAMPCPWARTEHRPSSIADRYEVKKRLHTEMNVSCSAEMTLDKSSHFLCVILSLLMDFRNALVVWNTCAVEYNYRVIKIL